MAFRGAFLWVFSLLLMTDWLDGKIARSSQQQTTFGARLDSIADATTYSAALLRAYWLKPEAIGPQIPLVLGGGWQLRRLSRALPRPIPSHAHVPWEPSSAGPLRRSASSAQFWISIWPLRIAMGALAVAHVEAMAITLLINWRPNVMTLYHSLRKH